ncbi:F0F1 ATP synthase subunit B [Gulosibacter molinativorax]|uniref:ATP synthase subunit b n=1 Tax=Gulosibacter molinativorax TaxID=256821 RepID=A0ABT7C3Q0_9MICO|nr:F0F1 ATP synthase subunit B [Gulosibacter molinativorax]MDJ1369874.1 F0F1 ATP synthase subunit B [Gulosibacter molinativorax]QUY61839.1 ATP synthase subunit b [Gulosibacter molinativorax]
MSIINDGTAVLAAATDNNNFGWDPSLLFPAVYDIVWSLVVLVVLLLFFWKFVLPQLNKILEERSAKIEGGIEQAAAVQAEADARKEEYVQLLAEARTEAAEIREKARAEGESIKAEKKQETQNELDRMTKTAKDQIEAERQSAIVSLRQEVGSLAIDLASGVVGESLSDDQRSTVYVDRVLSELDQKAGTNR